MEIIVAEIHNNSLGTVKSVSSFDEALDIARGKAEAKLNRALNDEEVDSLQDFYEIYNEEDGDNIWCISIGKVE